MNFTTTEQAEGLVLN